MLPTLTSERARRYRRKFDELDAAIAAQMDRWGMTILRGAVAIVFIWFGALKIFEVSPAGDLVAATVYLVPADLFVPILGVWEVLIGLCLLYRPLIRVGLFLLFFQLPGTFLPIVLLPDVVFVSFPYALTVEGQYIVKNLVIIGAALVIGSTVRDDYRGHREESPD
ncbi:hypothetical protein [Natronorubrum daqingense]|uniref:DoxX family protein n=2 Tax=Natronorubrum daqingense TaxID=588898 RepID=A0A1P8RE48_9EURY|nr:hypothetical protein BB347_09890 [Natronorubrum daqingense]